jgi:hypothetical protein
MSEDYQKAKEEKARRKLILCVQCSTSGKQVLHSWKRATGEEFKPAEDSNTER